MIRRIGFIVTLIVVLTSCEKTVEYGPLLESRPIFSDVYQLKDNMPDSALKLMQVVADTLDLSALRRFSCFQYAEYQILEAELNYKNYKPISNENEVMAAFDFFDSIMPGKFLSRIGDEFAFHKARAYYYKAVIEEFKFKDHVNAFTDYLNALWVMDGLNGKRWLFTFSDIKDEYEHFTALIYDRLAWFLYTYDAWDTSLDCLERSSECFKKEGNLLGVASNFELMGDVMLAQGDKEISLDYYKRSDSIHEKLKTDDIYQHFSSLFHRALDLYNAGEPNASFSLLHHALELSNNVWLNRQVHFSLGYLYYESQQYDSALCNYECSIPLLPRQTIKSYCRIIKAANLLGDDAKAAYYGELLSDMYLNQVAQSGDKTRMIMLYEGYKAESQDERNKSQLLFILSLVAILLVVLAINIFIIEWRRRRHKKELETQEKIKTLLESEVETAKRVSQQKEERIKSLEIELEKTISNPSFQQLPLEKKLETLYEMPISKRVRKVMTSNVKAGVAYPELVLSDNHITMLINSVDAVFPKFSIKLVERYPRLKRSDVVYCCMYILGITEVQAAALTGKTYQAVWTRSVKLHEIFDNKSNLQFVLCDFLKDW